MKYKFFKVAALDPESDEEQLNQFLASHQVFSIDKQLTQQGQNTYWVFAISYGVGWVELAKPSTIAVSLLGFANSTQPTNLRWINNGRNLRSAYRNNDIIIDDNNGFRLARAHIATRCRNRTRQHPVITMVVLLCKHQGCRGVSNRHESPSRNRLSQVYSC